MYSAEKNHKDCIQFLAQYEIGIENLKDDKKTALIYGYYFPDNLPLLLQEVKMKTSKGVTALMLAAGSGSKKSIKILAPYELGLKDNDGKTALMHAVFSERHEIIPMLSQEIKTVDNSGCTALHYACMYNYIECAQLLLEEAEIKDKNGQTPLQTAKERGHKDCAQLLEQYFANGKKLVCQQQELQAPTIKNLPQPTLSPLFASLNQIDQIEKGMQSSDKSQIKVNPISEEGMKNVAQNQQIQQQLIRTVEDPSGALLKYIKQLENQISLQQKQFDQKLLEKQNQIDCLINQLKKQETFIEKNKTELDFVNQQLRKEFREFQLQTQTQLKLLQGWQSSTEDLFLQLMLRVRGEQ